MPQRKGRGRVNAYGKGMRVRPLSQHFRLLVRLDHTHASPPMAALARVDMMTAAATYLAENGDGVLGAGRAAELGGFRDAGGRRGRCPDRPRLACEVVFGVISA